MRNTDLISLKHTTLSTCISAEVMFCLRWFFVSAITRKLWMNLHELRTGRATGYEELAEVCWVRVDTASQTSGVWTLLDI